MPHWHSLTFNVYTKVQSELQCLQSSTCFTKVFTQEYELLKMMNIWMTDSLCVPSISSSVVLIIPVYNKRQLRLNFVIPYNNHLSQEKATIRVFHIASKGQWSPYRYVTGMQDNLPDINTIYQISYTLKDFWCAIILSAD